MYNDLQESSKNSREKERRKKQTSREKMDLRRRLRQRNIQSQVNHSLSAVSPKSKVKSRVLKTLLIPQKKTKKSKGLQNQSIHFHKSIF